MDDYSLLRNPHLASYVSQTISIWARIDLDLTKLLSLFLTAEYQITFRMLQALRSSDAALAAFSAAAYTRLPAGSDKREIFDRVMKAIKSSRNRRNAFAHHIWADSPDLPDALLLINPVHLTEVHIQQAEVTREYDYQVSEFLKDYSKQHGPMKPGWTWPPEAPPMSEVIPTPALPRLDPMFVQVYRKNDLETDWFNAVKAHNLLSLLHFALTIAPPEHCSAVLAHLRGDKAPRESEG